MEKTTTEKTTAARGLVRACLARPWRRLSPALVAVMLLALTTEIAMSAGKPKLAPTDRGNAVAKACLQTRADASVPPMWSGQVRNYCAQTLVVKAVCRGADFHSDYPWAGAYARAGTSLFTLPPDGEWRPVTQTSSSCGDLDDVLLMACFRKDGASAESYDYIPQPTRGTLFDSTPSAGDGLAPLEFYDCFDTSEWQHDEETEAAATDLETIAADWTAKAAANDQNLLNSAHSSYAYCSAYLGSSTFHLSDVFPWDAEKGAYMPSAAAADRRDPNGLMPLWRQAVAHLNISSLSCEVDDGITIRRRWENFGGHGANLRIVRMNWRPDPQQDVP